MAATWLAVGVALGLLLAIPVAWLWSRRVERRVRVLEKRAQSAERLAELGTLTGGLAHEIKNPLSTINLNAQLLDEDLAELDVAGAKVESIRRRIRSMMRETQRLREILDDFLRFAGRVKLDRQPTDINAIVDDLAAFIEPQASAAGVRLRVQLAAAPAIAHVDASMLKQALLNLVLNAIQAMDSCRAGDAAHGGANELILRTHNARQFGQDQIHIHVTDTGPGMTPDVLDKIFQPYFTTKKGGTGLGLPTARRIVEEHGGLLTSHSEPGHGTDFVIALPTDPVVTAAPAATS